MVIIDEALLARFREAGRCELCGKTCDEREPHHVFGRGFGGGTRLDIALNLLAVGSSKRFECRCHHLAQALSIPRRAQLCVIALREKTTPEFIENEIHRLRRAPKRAA